MRKIVAALTAALLGCLTACQPLAPPVQTTKAEAVILHNDNSVLPVWHPNYHTAEAVVFEAGEATERELVGVQSPIPMKDRVKNYTGVQCVFASLECLGRWAEIKALTDPPLTSRADCKSYSGPSDAAAKMTRLGVRYEYSYRDRDKSVALLKRAMADGRGVLFGVPGHAMVLCHYDEAAGVVKYINNSNYRLPVETMSMRDFNRKWDTWVMVVYNTPDKFPVKARPADLLNLIPIIDRNSPQGKYDTDYIPKPEKN
jgi:hypothetical protein